MGSTTSKSARSAEALTTGRRNDSQRATYLVRELDNPFAQGNFRYVARGRYTNGNRRGQDSICKWFKSGIVFEDSFFKFDIKAVHKALEIVQAFNEEGVINETVRVNVPEVWTFDNDATGGRAGSKVLSEPYIELYQKFNSSTGWNNEESSWAAAMHPQSFQLPSHGRAIRTV